MGSGRLPEGMLAQSGAGGSIPCWEGGGRKPRDGRRTIPKAVSRGKPTCPRLPALSEGWRKEQEKFTARGAAHPDPLMGWGRMEELNFGYPTRAT